MRVGMEFGTGAVHGEDFHLDGDDFFLLQRGKHTFKDAIFRPAVDPSVKAVPTAIYGWEPPPFSAIFHGV